MIKVKETLLKYWKYILEFFANLIVISLSVYFAIHLFSSFIYQLILVCIIYYIVFKAVPEYIFKK